MTSYSNLQEEAYRPTQSLLFSEGEYSPKKSKQENFRPSLSVTFPESPGLGYSWREASTLTEDFPESQLWKTEVISGSSTQDILEATQSFAKTTSSTVINAMFVKRDNNLEETGLSCLLEPTFFDIRVNEQSNRPQTEAHQLEQLYIFREKAEILHFLEAKKFLLPLLEDAYTTIRSYFPASDLLLEVVIDPEITHERQLVIFIAIKENAEEASEALDKLDEDWWMGNMDRAQGSLCITLEFI